MFDEYDMAREELFYASLECERHLFKITPYIKRNLLSIRDMLMENTKT